MRLTALFENWYVDDGAAPLSVGETVRLPFRVYPRWLKPVARGEEQVQQIEDAEYRFIARVHYVHGPREKPDALTVEACGLGFHVENPKIEPKPGELLEGEGTLMVDLPGGMETVYGFWIPRDLSRILGVLGIWAVKIPERFIVRHEHGAGFPRYPSVLHPGEYEQEDKVPVSTMSGRRGELFEWEFFLVEFEDRGQTRGDRVSRALDYLVRKTLTLLGGQKISAACPTIWLRVRNPKARLSSLFMRLSPSTKNESAGSISGP